MRFFNKKAIEALLKRKYICSECGAEMEFEDEWEEVLICHKCGHLIDSEMYGFENDEDYDALYPTEEELLDFENENDEDNEYGETYEEVCGELSDD